VNLVVHLVRSGLAPVTRTRAFRWLGPRLLPPFELLVQGLTGGRVQVSGLLVHSLTLRTVGARSGELRDTELMYTPDGHGSAIVAGTSFARDRHPGWTYNLLAHPDAEIAVRGRRLAVRATLLGSGPDGESVRDAAWTLIEAQWPGYRAYERESGRTVRLFLLTPVAELSDPLVSIRPSGATQPAK
jgi:deazaflavin-dependent oxidoreductase (nitroreductase family)